MSLLLSLARAVNWLRAGYPTEAPEGHIALIALMSSKGPAPKPAWRVQMGPHSCGSRTKPGRHGALARARKVSRVPGHRRCGPGSPQTPLESRARRGLATHRTQKEPGEPAAL